MFEYLVYSWLNSLGRLRGHDLVKDESLGAGCEVSKDLLITASFKVSILFLS